MPVIVSCGFHHIRDVDDAAVGNDAGLDLRAVLK
jgi:hypothetical protein